MLHDSGAESAIKVRTRRNYSTSLDLEISNSEFKEASSLFQKSTDPA